MSDPFIGLDYNLVREYKRNLPHWRQESAVYFVTFRLRDSIPDQVMEEWQHDARDWLRHHGITDSMSKEERTKRYIQIRPEVRRRFERDQAHRFFIELDKCHGACPLRDRQHSEILADAMCFYEGARLRSGDFVIMPNHAHWLLQILPGHNLETVLGSIKQWSARRINGLRGTKGELWQRETYDHIVRDEEQYDRIRAYIEENPSKANLRPGEFRYCRADLR